ncbi:(4Fe-4S)-binding protein [Tamlana crocina]|uniref:(4Fe-4S)-binding protein n=1 Tax=Tamlana crocina TaxID=393006 RepID=A0ABX1DED4_9FLAO|nr:(4Fe-4S)-binding protein [Tamlana crocina]NJX14656.1 (4Fe-4S)-binding protein [Tamlana crocina]
MEINANKFSNKEVTVTYDPCTCKLSGRCYKELPEVFMDSVIPWVDLEGAPAEAIQEQVNRCPTGALKFHYKNPPVKVSKEEQKQKAKKALAY